MMVTVHTIAISRGSPLVLSTSPFETMSSIYELLSGTGHLSSNILDPKSSSQYRNLIKGERYFSVSPNSPTSLPDDVDDALRALRQQVARRASPTHDDSSHYYTSAIDNLETAFRITSQSHGPPFGTIVAWPINLDSTAFSLYRQADPLMLLIFVHYGVLYLSLNARWWAQGFGVRIIQTLSDYLHSVDVAWSHSTAWALAKAALTFP